jgi:hypothetical protein
MSKFQFSLIINLPIKDVYNRNIPLIAQFKTLLPNDMPNESLQITY